MPVTPITIQGATQADEDKIVAGYAGDYPDEGITDMAGVKTIVMQQMQGVAISCNARTKGSDGEASYVTPILT